MAAEISHDRSITMAKTGVTLDHEKQALRHDKVDAALEFLNHESGTVAEVDEKALVRKIDWRIVPLMCECPGSVLLCRHQADISSQGLVIICSIWTRYWVSPPKSSLNRKAATADTLPVNYANVMGLEEDTGSTQTTPSSTHCSSTSKV